MNRRDRIEKELDSMNKGDRFTCEEMTKRVKDFNRGCITVRTMRNILREYEGSRFEVCGKNYDNTNLYVVI